MKLLILKPKKRNNKSAAVSFTLFSNLAETSSIKMFSMFSEVCMSIHRIPASLRFRARSSYFIHQSQFIFNSCLTTPTLKEPYPCYLTLLKLALSQRTQGGFFTDRSLRHSSNSSN